MDDLIRREDAIRLVWNALNLSDACYELRRMPAANAVTINENVYDQEELHPDCTVQILRNSLTGEISVGWWENEEAEE